MQARFGMEGLPRVVVDYEAGMLRRQGPPARENVARGAKPRDAAGVHSLGARGYEIASFSQESLMFALRLNTPADENAATGRPNLFGG